jgi:hypothetical protein
MAASIMITAGTASVRETATAGATMTANETTIGNIAIDKTIR